jgi:hypothetical protein
LLGLSIIVAFGARLSVQRSQRRRACTPREHL